MYSNIIEANLGVDLLLDVIKFGNNSLGIFGGVEGGGVIVISDDKKYEGITRVASYSSLEFLAEHHRIEFVTKIPAYTLNPDGDENIYKPLQFMLGYKYVF